MNWEAVLQDCDELDAERRRRIGRARSCRPKRSRQPSGKREVSMARIDLHSLGIEELVALRERATEKLFESSAVL
jgi:hypothetical protein